ncbi:MULTISPECIES: ABC transporter ATP-binding protein [Thioclava]|uniref:ABC transporter ATP-binding protein n=1 Tax=Thioclava litoralis TaxID=3076557 RepID=A0ABZ1E3Z6_9RHOB|nr:ABC transporter ATP-binding protein [Thioclava sp. FTW29]
MAKRNIYTSRHMVARIWRDYLRPHVGWMAIALLLMVVEGSTLGALSWLLQPLFDKVFSGKEPGLIYWAGGAVFALFLIRAATSIASKTIMTKISQSTSTAMQVDLVGHVLRLDQSFFQINPPGALIERIQGDTQAVQNIWKAFITGAGRDAISLVGLMAVALGVDVVWTLVAMVGFPLLLAPAVIAQRYIRRKTMQMRDSSSQRATRLDEMFHGINAVKLNRIEDQQTGRFRVLVNRIMGQQIKMAATRALIPAMVDIVTGLGFFAVLVVAGHGILSGQRTVGEFMSFFTAMTLTFQPIRRLAAGTGEWQTAAASLERIYTLFDLHPTVAAPLHPAQVPASLDITVENVTLSYGATQVLHGLSFTAKEGQTTALVGPSGAGKSTVFALLSRLLDPDGGQILLGGADIRTLDLGQLRQMFSTVAQDAALFDETIRENVLLGKTVSDERLRQALDGAYVSEFTQDLPEGIDTPAGPRGSALSGGQRQRVAIARAILRDAPILLLDEATSALDTASEKRVSEALEKLSVGRTTLVIAHRLSTVRNADKIVVIREGRVEDEGTHEELLARGGTYADLCAMQLIE